jgi:hypothetical protein
MYENERKKGKITCEPPSTENESTEDDSSNEQTDEKNE